MIISGNDAGFLWDFEWWGSRERLVLSLVRACCHNKKLIYFQEMGWITNGKCHSTKRLDGKVVIVTGSNTGIGKYTALDLSRRGAEVIMACRNLEKAKEAEADIRKRVPEAKLKVMHLDLSSLESVRTFSKDFLASYDSLHILINNAGVMFHPWELSKDGFEMHIATNHLGHFLLTLLLLPLLRKCAPSRIINVSSIGHRLSSSMRYDDFNYERSYSSIGGYTRSKLANILFTNELARRLKGFVLFTFSEFKVCYVLLIGL
ncbi:unnamed protein product [Nezara viridula]|uniref:Uncharacterized protein n=1 Tax=Nezara viridula TaxID=85310 RepID=A0A9P0MT77_NEZVI|nr:unnamed protein product [Nezara viridula]